MYRAFSPSHISYSETLEISAPIAAANRFEGIFVNIENEKSLGIQKIKDLLAKYNLKAAGFELPTSFYKEESEFEEDLIKLERLAKFAKDCGFNDCTTYVFPASETLDFAENFKLHTERGKQINEILKGNGIRFGLEFVGPYTLRKDARYTFIHDLDGILELCDAIGDVGLLLDVFHWDLAGQTKEDFRKIKDASKIVCVHINDAPAGVPFDEQLDQVRKLPGSTGVLRIGAFFDGLLELGYDGPVVCEPFVKELREMSLEEAAKMVAEAYDIVWPV